MNNEENDPLPIEWNSFRIGEKFDFTVKPKGLRFENHQAIPFVPMERIPSDRLFFSDFVLKKPQEISSGTYFEEGDLLVSKITPCFENGKQGIATKIPGSFGVATTEVIPIKAKEGVSHLPFLAMYLLDSKVRNSLAGKMEGATGRQRLSKSVLEDWSMPFPPLPEQHVISAVLAKIQAVVEVQDKIVATLKELKAATMAKLFREGLHGEPLKQTEIGEMPENWKVLKLGSLTTKKITDGTHVTPKYVDEGIPFVTATNLIEDTIDLVGCKKISLEEHLQLAKRCQPERGDILLTKVGTLGLVVKVETDDPFSIFVQVALIKVDNTKVSASYLKHALKSETIQKRIHNRASRSTMMYIGVGKIAELEIPIPATEEQEELVAIFDALDARIAIARYRLASLRFLFSSMLHLLMTGQVRVKSEIRVAGGVTMAKANASQEYGQAGPSKSLPEGVKRFVEEIARQFVPERIILFGSYAEGSVTPDSDMDLLVVMEFEGRARDQAARIGAFMRRDFPLDLLVRRPEDLRRLIESGDPFFREIVEKGEVLYARSK